MQIEFSRSAVKALRDMQRAKALDIRAALDRVAADPFSPNNNLAPLTGVPQGYRLRIGDWRASYRIDRRNKLMIVFEIAPRGGAYR